MSDAKAPLEYWESVWQGTTVPRPVDLGKGYRSYVHGVFARIIADCLSLVSPAAGRVIEIGCGNSPWMPSYESLFGVTADGIDFSSTGCAMAQRLMHESGGGGQVYFADFFEPPAPLLETYDAALSFGVLEHFADTAQAVRAVKRFVRPGGAVITFVPNFGGLMGTLQRVVSRDVYDKHVPLDASALAKAHSAAGLRIVAKGHAPAFSLDVVAPGDSPLRPALRLATAILGRAAYVLDSTLGLVPRRSLAPYAYTAALV